MCRTHEPPRKNITKGIRYNKRAEGEDRDAGTAQTEETVVVGRLSIAESHKELLEKAEESRRLNTANGMVVADQVVSMQIKDLGENVTPCPREHP